jgi:hypothetical protein
VGEDDVVVALGAPGRVAAGERAEPFDAGGVAVDEVVGVVDDGLRIGLDVADAQLVAEVEFAQMASSFASSGSATMTCVRTCPPEPRMI